MWFLRPGGFGGFERGEGWGGWQLDDVLAERFGERGEAVVPCGFGVDEFALPECGEARVFGIE